MSLYCSNEIVDMGPKSIDLRSGLYVEDKSMEIAQGRSNRKLHY